MARTYSGGLQTVEVITDIRCDVCGRSTKAQTHDGFEKAIVMGAFNETIHAGDRWVIELCQNCFHDFLEWLLLDKLGTCLYHNVEEENKEDPMEETDIEDIRAFFANRRTERLKK